MPRPRKGLTLIELLVVIGIMAVLIMLLLPAIQAGREAARRARCGNNVRQIGLALHGYYANHSQFPSGWDADTPTGDPGWAWGTAILPYLEHTVVIPQRRPRGRAIGHPDNRNLRASPISVFLCPSDASPKVFMMRATPGRGPGENPGRGNGPPMFELARANYAGVFGTQTIENTPSQGDGTFFQNSQIRFTDIHDGLSNTAIIGERSSRLGSATWVGAVPGAHRSMARVVGIADRVPNDVLNQFADFSSHHVYGANFLMADSSVQLISDQVDLPIYKAYVTRSGGEVSPNQQ